MAEITHLDNAPIKEAIIDIQIDRDEEYQLESLKQLHEKFKDDYPDMEVIAENRLGVKISKEDCNVTTTSENKVIGYKFNSLDSKNIVQFYNNRFSFARLEPYEKWETMSEEARRLWDIYKQSCSSCTVIRVATRFINVMRIPLPITEFKEYLTAPPEIPDELPQGVSSFITRIVMQNPQLGTSAIITQALESVESEHAPITLDIDVFKKGEYDLNDDSYWDTIEELRHFKNEIFFKSISDKTAGLFK